MQFNEPRHAQMDIPSSPAFLRPAVDFILSSAEEMGLQSHRSTRLRSLTHTTLATLFERNRSAAFEQGIHIDISEEEHELVVAVTNRGLPVLDHNSPIHDAVRAAQPLADRATIENLGRGGQRFVFRYQLYPPIRVIDKGARHPVLPFVTTADDHIRIRELHRGEEESLTELFFNVYEYNYINDYVYYPEKIRAMLESGKLRSFIGETNTGRVVGHVGLVQLNDTPAVYEAALGVVDPRIKSRGLFSRIFDQVMQNVATLPMSYCVFDFVTNHDYSQKLVARYGTQDMALYIGCQSKETQANLQKLGLGQDPTDMDRYSLLLSVVPKEQNAFGEEILLPSSIGGSLGFLLKPLNVTWVPAPRFYPLPEGGEFKQDLQPTQKSVIFDLHQPGKAAVKRIVETWQHLMRDGYQYAGVNVPTSAPGLGHLYDSLAAHGFFMGGFIPYRYSRELGFRFQALAPTKVAFENIKVCTENAKRLLAVVRADYERNRLL